MRCREICSRSCCNKGEAPRNVYDIATGSATVRAMQKQRIGPGVDVAFAGEVTPMLRTCSEVRELAPI